MKKRIKISCWLLTVSAIACLALMLICNQVVVNNANEIETDSQTAIYSFLGKPIIINDFLCDQIASVPNFGVDNGLPKNMTLEEYAQMNPEEFIKAVKLINKEKNEKNA